MKNFANEFNKILTEEEIIEILKFNLDDLINVVRHTSIDYNNSALVIGLSMFKSKWKAPIYNLLIKNECMRYGELKKVLKNYDESITNNMLAATLHEMEEDGLIYRKQYPDIIPPHVDYMLTESAKEFLYVKMQMSLWVRRHKKYLSKNEKTSKN